jgi:hypothetical protein
MKSRNLKYTIKGSGGLKAEESGLIRATILGGMLWTLKAKHVHVDNGIFLVNLALML